jgi:cysteine-rich repeat protein
VRNLLIVVSIALFASPSLADTTPQSLPFTQNWTNVGLITADDMWSGVPGIEGHLGRDITMVLAADPQTLVTESTVANDVDVIANQTMPNTQTNGGVAEFELADPTIALQGSGGADAAHILITVNTTGVAFVRVAYSLRDIDGSTDNAIQPVALQYRVGTTGSFTNVAAGFVADASTGPSLATLVTAVSALLPAQAGNQPVVQIRIITSNAQSLDEWIGVDNIAITSAATNPSATGVAMPASALPSTATKLKATVTAGTLPTSTGVGVTCDLTAIGGSATQQLFDDATNGDTTAGDNSFAFATTVGAASVPGAKTLPCTVSDAQTRSATFNIAFVVSAVCGDGITEGVETCDDMDAMAGDGCSATCVVEAGYTCTTASPSVCTDVDECADSTDNCAANAMCSNTAGGFMCACNTGYSGNGITCTDINECTAGTDNCDVNATCTNQSGSFTCACKSGFMGNGTTCTTMCGDGIMIGQEDCDDGDMNSGDGCSMSCQFEAGFECAGVPSLCRPVCGDGMTVGAESCDDSNTHDGDGCDAHCQVEPDGSDDDGGGCCSSSTNPGGVALLVMVVMIGLRRRQRR